MRRPWPVLAPLVLAGCTASAPVAPVATSRTDAAVASVVDRIASTTSPKRRWFGYDWFGLPMDLATKVSDDCQ